MPQAKKVVMLRLEVSTKVEEREGYFAAITDPFAVVAYGDTPEKAEKRAFEALDLLLQQHSKTPKEMSAYLTRFGVKHLMVSDVMPERRFKVVRECKREIQLEEFACA